MNKPTSKFFSLVRIQESRNIMNHIYDATKFDKYSFQIVFT